MTAETIVFGVLGLIIGSFLNVVILRHGARSLGGRSGCIACGTQLGWFEIIPVFSWLALRARCRYCGARISIQYPLVEVGTAVLFALIGGAPLSLFSQAINIIIAALLVIIVVYDIRHTIIPNEWVYAFAFLAFIASLAGTVGETDEINFVLFLFAGPLAAFPLFALWFISRGRWMGLSDAKLALGIGWLLGVSFGLYAVFFAFVIGAVVCVFIILPFKYITHVFWITRSNDLQTGFAMESDVPFGPFLIASCVLAWCAMMYGIRVPLFF
jgi:leader peptidase (prepilin peptidase) / N-methyltransferase